MGETHEDVSGRLRQEHREALARLIYRSLGSAMKRKQYAFTLIELLTVITIIAVLSAIAFPVFSRVREDAHRNADLADMNELRMALQLYRVDQGAYPPQLLGYATGYLDAIPSAADIVPANQVVGALYPRRVQSLETFRPSLVRGFTGNLATEFTTAVWPNRLGPGGPGQPQQRFGPGDGNVRRAIRLGGTCTVVDAFFYRQSGYDAATVPIPGGSRHELRYTLFWSGFTVPADPCNPTAFEQGSGADSPRQLGYSDPPETTVVTWNSFYRGYVDGVPQASRRDLVLFLGGGVRTMDSRAVSEQSWAIQP